MLSDTTVYLLATVVVQNTRLSYHHEMNETGSYLDLRPRPVTVGSSTELVVHNDVRPKRCRPNGLSRVAASVKVPSLSTGRKAGRLGPLVGQSANPWGAFAA